MTDEPEFNRFVRVMAKFSIAGMVAHLSGAVTQAMSDELLSRLLHEERLQKVVVTPKGSRALLRLAGKDAFTAAWNIEIKKAAEVLPPEHREGAVAHFTAAAAWRRIMY